MKKYLKMMVVFSLVLVLPMLAIGCGNGQAKNEKVENSNAAAAKKAEAADVTSQNATSASKEEAKSASSQEEAKSATSEKEAKNAEPKVQDPYAMYRVSEEWIKEMLNLNKSPFMVVERDGVFYSLLGRVPQKVLDDYGVGYVSGSRGLEDITYLFLSDAGDVTGVPASTDRALLTAGDFPLIKVSRNEQVRLYAKYEISNIAIMPTEQIGYTIEAIVHSDNQMYSPVLNDTMIGGQIRGINPSVCDMTDTPVADVHDLEYGQNYKYIWYEGTEYHEMVLPAICKCYNLKVSSLPTKEMISLPVILGKEGYATVDFSGLAPGTYYTMMYGSLFEIVE